MDPFSQGRFPLEDSSLLGIVCFIIIYIHELVVLAFPRQVNVVSQNYYRVPIKIKAWTSSHASDQLASEYLHTKQP